MATDWLLTQNSRMKAQGIFNWTLPAWAVTLKDEAPDGTITTRNINVCPQAGVCAKFCYALDGAYRYPNVRQRHENNLRLVLDTPWSGKSAWPPNCATAGTQEPQSASTTRAISSRTPTPCSGSN